MQELFAGIVPVVRKRPTMLIPFNWVKDQLGFKGMSYRGFRAVEIDKIVGSLNRYQDFDRAFLPLRATVERTKRLQRLENAIDRGEELPPVRLYKVGEVYFVEDGHHRVAAARNHGARYIDAELTEFEPNVPIEAGITEKDILIKSEYVDFLRRTHMDVLRPENHLKFTEQGQYRATLEHIDVHRHFLELEQQRDVPYEEAVTSWYDHVYAPLVAIFRRLDVLKHFPGRTESDLYVWVSEHLYNLRKRYGPHVSLEQAVLDYADHHQLNWLARLLHNTQRR